MTWPVEPSTSLGDSDASWVPPSDQQDLRDAAAWAKDTLFPLGLPAGEMTERLLAWFVGEGIVSPPDDALAALVATARRAFEDRLLATIAGSLSAEQKHQLDGSLADDDRDCGFTGLKADPGSPDLEHVLVHARRLAFVKSLALRVTSADHRGLTPAIHAHINPYGRFDADFTRRIDLDLPLAA